MPTLSIKSMLLSLVLLCFGGKTHAQTLQQRLDSLEGVQLDDTSLVIAWRNLAADYFQQRQDTALLLFSSAEELATQLGWRAGRYRILQSMGRLWSERQDYSKSLDAYLKSLAIAEDIAHRKWIADAMVFVGLVHYEMENYSEALDYYRRSLLICREDGYAMGVLRQNNNIGTVYERMGNIDSAITYYERSATLADSLNREYAMSLIGVNLANCYVYLGKYENGREVLNRCIAAVKRTKNSNVLAKVYGNVGIWYLQQVKNHPSRDKETLDRYNLQIAIKNLRIAARVHDSLQQLNELKQWYYNLKQAYGLLGPADSTLKYFEKYISVRDTLFSIEKQRRIAELEAVRDVAARDRKIAVLKKEGELRQLRETGLWIGLMLLAIIAILLILWLKAKAKQAKQAEKHAEHRQQQLQENLDLRNRQLTSHALQLLQKNALMESLKEDIKELHKTVDEGPRKALGQLMAQVSQGLQLDQDWEKFKIYFEEVHPTFFKSLDQHSSGLTQNEMRHAAMVKLGISVKESASILKVEPGSVKMARNRLKKKLALDATDDLNTFLRAID